jgi:hypothetical protein
LNPARLRRPLLAIAISGALLTGSTLTASPALAAENTPATGSETPATGSETPGSGSETPGSGSETPGSSGSNDSSGSSGNGAGSADPGSGSDGSGGSGSGGSDSNDGGSGTGDGGSGNGGSDSDSGSGEAGPGSGTTDPEPGAGDPEPEPTEPADTVNPTGKFKLDTGALWIGQKVTLTQGEVSDDKSLASAIRRVVNWGDGSSSTLQAGQAPIKKQYAKVGKYTITFTVTDEAGNFSSTTSALNVTKPGTFKLERTSAWLGQRTKITMTGVPSGTTKIAVYSGDGYSMNIKPKSQSWWELYYRHAKTKKIISGKVTPTVVFYNKLGASSSIPVGTITIKKDTWKPVVKVKKPANANRVASWKTVTGTFSDKGSGAPSVFVFVTKNAGGKVYCYTPQKKWKRVTSQAQLNKCQPVTVKQSKGKWSLKINGLAKKNRVWVDAVTSDWSGNDSKWSSVSATLTRS